ncbi:hypothetical protein FOQG_07159 [Fusarium oxysporum f. sp. raphani 54005]|uniref:Uncharacterized protein n=2 Tax=Fusarium oxysporum TaxID=5507 RepID=X0CHN9_FUSOX|nr:hypothetical protein FOVG_11867 [Fusarium oxysporum f. sp. pisi HDV247]EXK90349.1 hypothetical protein FOQG_07159 [Fusarium oxysporum f. sp. raphani 54005]
MGWYAEVVVNSIGFWGEFLGKTVEMASHHEKPRNLPKAVGLLMMMLRHGLSAFVWRIPVPKEPDDPTEPK